MVLSGAGLGGGGVGGGNVGASFGGIGVSTGSGEADRAGDLRDQRPPAQNTALTTKISAATTTW
jgi:hypothetical protein